MADFAINQIVRFGGYASLEPGFQPLLEPGMFLKITKIDSGDDGSPAKLTVFAIGSDTADEVFADEVEEVAEEDIPAEARVTAKGKKSKAKAKKATEITEQPEEEQTVTPIEVVAEKTVKAKKSKRAIIDDAPAAPVVPDTPFEADAKEWEGEVQNEAHTAMQVSSIVPSPAVRDILARMDDAHAAAKSLVEQGEKTDFTLGGVLYEIHEQNLYWKVRGEDGVERDFGGKRGFEEYAEQFLGIQYRKAMYLIKIYTSFRKLDIDESKLGKIGWSKAKELTRLAKLTDEEGNSILQRDFDKLVEYIEDDTNTREDLIEHIKTSYLNANQVERVRKSKFNFVLVGEAGDNVNQILNEAAQATEDPANLNVVFEQIVTEWAMTSGRLSLEQSIAAIQNQFGVTLGVVEDSGEAPSEHEVN